MKKLFALLLIFSFSMQILYSAEYDSSIDAEIRKNYNVDELPALPKAPPSKIIMNEEIKNYKSEGKTYTIKNGTKVTLISKSDISNYASIGNKVSFLSQNPISTKEGVTIPAGTLFKASVTDSHPPQITGNGGLIELKFNEIYFNGIMSHISSKLSEADSRQIFRNDIKGQRKYWKNCSKVMKPGEKTFRIMKNTGKSISAFPVINILSIVPLAIGSAVYITNASLAPVISVFMKGGTAKLPSGTVFVIKISGDNQIQG